VRKQESRGRTLAGFIFAAAAGVFQIVALKRQFFIFGPAAAILQLGSTFEKYYLLIVATTVLGVAVYALEVFAPRLRRFNFIARTIARVAELVTGVLLIVSGDLIAPVRATYADLAATVNSWMIVGATVMVAIGTVMLIWRTVKHRYQLMMPLRTA
jgi:hypothetical protein